MSGHRLIIAMRRLMEQPTVNTYAALVLAMRITEVSPALFDQLGIYEDGAWL